MNESTKTDFDKFSPPRPGEYHEYYEGYICRVDPATCSAQFASQPRQLKKLLGNLAPGEDEKLHEPYTWTLKQVMGHMIDCERSFSDRMLRIATGDETPIPGIDQNQYVAALNYKDVSMKSLLKEFRHLRKANVELVKRLTAESLSNMGVASNSPTSARANLYILVGHVLHHLEVIERRLGSDS